MFGIFITCLVAYIGYALGRSRERDLQNKRHQEELSSVGQSE